MELPEHEFENRWSVEACLSRLPQPNRIMAPFQYIGGKGKMAKWVIKHLPKEGRTYVEPFAGAASVFWHIVEHQAFEHYVLNDRDPRIITLYRVLQDRESFEVLRHRIVFTLNAREEYGRAIEVLREGGKDDIEIAWAFYVMTNYTVGGNIGQVRLKTGTWRRVKKLLRRGIADNCNTRRTRMKMLDWWHKNIQGVTLINGDGIDCLCEYDSEDTVFYVDPPYILDTRKSVSVYYEEPDENYHKRLVDVLLSLKGSVVLSGYDHPIYEPLSTKWQKIIRKTRTTAIVNPEARSRNSERTEVLWINPKAQSQLKMSF